MSDDFDIDSRELAAAMQLYEEATGRDEVYIVNRAARNIAFRAAAYTPKAKQNRIRADLEKAGRSGSEIKYALTSALLKKKGIGTLPKGQFQKAVDRFVASRVASAGYTRAGWAKAIRAFGGTFKGRLSAKGNAANGYGIPARKAIHVVAEIANAANNADKVGGGALQKAVDFVAADMTAWAENLLASTSDKFSAK